MKNLSLEAVRKEAASMEVETRHFYEQAMARTTDANTRQLLGDLFEAERACDGGGGSGEAAGAGADEEG